MTINCTVFYVHLIIQLFIYLVLLTNKLQSRNQTDWWANVCMCVQSSHKNANINLSLSPLNMEILPEKTDTKYLSTII